MRKSDKLLVIIAIILLVAGACCIGFVVTYYLKGSKSLNDNKRLSEIFWEDIKVDKNNNLLDDDADGLEDDTDDLKQIKESIKKLQEINRDIVGWIRIDGTQIDYPIVQTIDNDYYLTHDIYGKYNKRGSVFLDCRNVIGGDADLTQTYILYAHNMKDRTMFGHLRDFLNKDYLEDHAIAHLYTEAGDTVFELTDTIIVDSLSDNAAKYYMTDTKKTGLILSTCSSEDDRLLLIGQQIDY